MTPKLVDYLLYEPEDNGILWIKFNRPERMNSLIGSAEENSTVAKVGEYMRAGDDDPNVRVIVLTGVGRGFCSGADMRGDTPDSIKGERFSGDRGTTEGPDATREHFIHGFTKLHRDIALIRKPTVAMINGAAVGSGMDMALHCDIRLGCENTRFIGYQQLGQIIENGGSYYLPKMVGLGRALEFAYTGHLNAQKAYEWGLLNYLVSSYHPRSWSRLPVTYAVESPALPPWSSGLASASCVPPWTRLWKTP